MTEPMRWVLQNNIYSEEGWDDLVGAIRRLGLPLSEHKVVPFMDGQAERLDRGFLTTDPLDPPPEIPDGGRAFVMGSYTLANYAQRRRWVPGALLDNLDAITQMTRWHQRMLNYDSIFSRFGTITRAGVEELVGDAPTFFIRPVHDTKSFTGHVTDWDTFADWQRGVLALTPEDNPTITPKTLCVIARVQEIYSETRTWVIPGHRTISSVVTSSRYKIGCRKAYAPPEATDQRIIEFVDGLVSDWYPNEAFVLDVADTPDGLRAIEVNNVNSAGIYKADVSRLVMALQDRFG